MGWQADEAQVAKNVDIAVLKKLLASQAQTDARLDEALRTLQMLLDTALPHRLTEEYLVPAVVFTRARKALEPQGAQG